MSSVSRGVLVAVAVAVVAITAAVALKSWCSFPPGAADQYLRWCYTDIVPLYHAEGLAGGAVPYLDHPVEYPVLTGLWMWLASVPADSEAAFMLWTALVLLVSGVVTAWLLAREVGWPRVLAFAAAPTLLISGAVNWDLPAVALATAGLIAHRRDHDGWAGALLGFGAAAKLYPALLLPAVVLAAWRLRGQQAGIRTGGAALGAWSAVNLPVLIAAPESWGRFYTLSRSRVADWDALSSVLFEITAWHQDVAVLNAVTGIVMVVGIVTLLVLAVRHTDPRRWHLVGLPVLALFLLTNKVYSPQFSLWLLPLFALAFPGWGWWTAFAVADVAVTATRFPYLANFVDGGLDGAWPYAPFAVALVIRAVVLAGAAWVGWRRSATPTGTGTSDVSPVRVAAA